MHCLRKSSVFVAADTPLWHQHAELHSLVQISSYERQTQGRQYELQHLMEI